MEFFLVSYPVIRKLIGERLGEMDFHPRTGLTVKNVLWVMSFCLGDLLICSNWQSLIQPGGHQSANDSCSWGHLKVSFLRVSFSTFLVDGVDGRLSFENLDLVLARWGCKIGPWRSLPQNLHRRCQFFVEAQIGPTLNPAQSSNFVKDLSHDSLTNWSTEAASEAISCAPQQGRPLCWQGF